VLFWAVGESPEPKRFEIGVDQAMATLTGVQCAQSEFVVQLERVEGTNQYAVVVTPLSTAQVKQATIRLQAMVDHKPRVYALYTAVK
jgi:hypothetical protein